MLKKGLQISLIFQFINTWFIKMEKLRIIFFGKNDLYYLKKQWPIIKIEKTHVFAFNFFPNWSNQNMCHNLKTYKFKF